MFNRVSGLLMLAAVHASQPAVAQQPASSLNVAELFATTCGFCHNDGGRAPGRGPQLMNNPHNDDFLRARIKIGKEGAMPAFGTVYSDADVDAIIAYIRSLKPEQG